MECTSSSSQHHHLPPGFRFHPTDEELVVHYLKKKAASVPLPVNIIAEIELYKYDPWELPSKASFGEHEWYFFTPRDRKYPNGARPNRAATSGYWKATGTDKPIHTANVAQKVAVKKALVFYGGKPPKGIKSNWMMHEYRLVDNKPPGSIALNNRGSSRLDDWVLCRIFKKSTSSSRLMDHREQDESMERDLLPSLPSGSAMNVYRNQIPGSVKPEDHESGLSFENYNENYFPGILSENGPTTYHGSTSSKTDFAKLSAMSGYWNGMINGSLLLSKQWIADQDEDKNNSGTYNENTTSFTSLINENSDHTADFKHNSTL